MFKIIICLLLITTIQASTSSHWGFTTKPGFTSITRSTSYKSMTASRSTTTSRTTNQIVAEGKFVVGIKKGAIDKLLPMAINTWNFTDANAMAWRILKQSRGGVRQTRNAVVEGCTKCEQLQCDGTVGYGGSPDEQGETTLDAMVMDGATMDVGAVAGMRLIKDAIRVARHVLERTAHTMLVGDAATEFAISMGFRSESLVTPESKTMYQQWKAKDCQPNFWRNVHPDPKISCGPYEPTATPLTRWKEDRARTEYQIGAKHHDTIGMIAIDVDHHIHAGTSTNGARHKIHGRVGDSPIPGAGAYADNEVGAAVATGDGDVMMRFLPTLLAVEAMRNGKSPAEAAEVGIRRILKHYKEFSGAVIAVNRLGQYAAACHGMREFPFVVSNPTQAIHVETVKCLPPEPSVEVVPLTKQT
ncbi:putative N(4)-(beta-N-acetylglucosaminyl)-L-asparaginase GA14866 [Drosophila busckii]|uniref:putative N(4)-(beta-N-acetylglucosaminyl)-L-asparaginase GA14866 n=1 Tax=Drosophila busckii TaxID=30019 RepID=UPI00083EFA1E|nr:putative N(4)-(beta-N-acetylglucosaminyl)-L-asparaginase GA14866 [Drosophila busckii]